MLGMFAQSDTRCKNRRNQRVRSPKKSFDWVQYVEKDATKLVVPVGPRFQATVPELAEQDFGGSSDDARWLGTRTWPTSEERSSNIEMGKGRRDSCDCAGDAGSVKCISLHVSEERKKLVSELGPAFKAWKFDTMGEAVSETWRDEEQQRFDMLVRRNPVSKDKTFLKPAVKAFPSKTEEEIVNYYLNVYIPKRIGQQVRSGVLEIDTDDETEIKPADSLKRSHPGKGESSKNVKPRYLAGKR